MLSMPLFDLQCLEVSLSLSEVAAGTGGFPAGQSNQALSGRLSSLLLGPPASASASHLTKNSWEDIPLFNPQFANAQAAAHSGSSTGLAPAALDTPAR